MRTTPATFCVLVLVATTACTVAQPTHDLMHPPPANLYSRIRSMMGFSSEPLAPPSTTSTTTTVLSSPCTQTCFAGDVHVLLEAAVKLQNRNRTIAGLAPFPIPSKTQTLPIWRQRSDGPSGLERVAKTIGIAIHVYPLPTPTAYLPSPVSYLPDSAPDTLAEVVFVAGGPDLAPPYRLLVPEDLVLRSRVDVQGLRKVSNPLLGRCSDSATPSADPTPPTDRAAPATPHATPHPPTPRTAPVVSPFAPHVNISLHEFKQLFDAFAEHQRLANDKRALRGEHDPRRTTAILSQRLIKLAHDMKLPVDTKVVLVVGDQTVGKSTFIMSLQERVMLLQDSATGTRFRTFIRSEFDPSLDKDAEVADFSYTNVERGIHENRRGLTPLQLFDLSDEVSRGPNPRGLKSYWDKAGVDGNGMAEMVMRHGGTSIGVSIIDHPGIKRADAYGKPDTIKATESSLREHFPDSGKSNGVVLITYSAVSDPSQHSWQDVDFKPLVKNGRSGEDLYVGITKFNLLTLTDLARLVRSEGREDGVTLTEVIDMVSKQLLDTLDDMGLKPKRVFLLPGSSEDTPVLRKIQNDRERLETFLESERKNTESIIKRLLDRDAWEKEGITITSDPDEDVAMLVDRIGVRHARREFQRLQRRAFVDVSKEVAASVRKELQQLRARQMALDASASLESAYEDEVVNFFLSVGSIFGTMASSQPYSEETADVLAEMEKEPEYGFTLADFERLLAELPHRSEFPRDEFRIDNYDVVFDDLIKRTISDDNRMPNLPSLINIIKYMWAIRCQLIEPPDVDPQDVLDRSASTTRVSVKNTLERLAAESTRHYRDLYASKGGKTGGGFAYVSQYAATAFVMQADLVLQLLFRSGKFERLLPERVDLLAEVPKMTVSAMSSKPQSNEYKLSSMSGRPIEDLWPSVLESLHKHADVEGGALARLQRDLRRVLVSQYFDEPYDMVLSNLEQQGRALTDQHTPQYPTLMQFGHLFVHQDPSFMDLFAQARPTSAFSQTFLHKRAGTEPAVPLHPDISTPEDIKLYLWLSQEWRDAAASTMRVPPAGPAERADFLVSTLRLVDMPDVALMQQSEDRTDATFAQSLKYVHRRTMSAANFETWRVGDRLLTSSLSAYISRSTMPRFQQKMIDSFLSLLLGFGHPYSEFKRPNSLRAQLDPAQVIRVLYNERHIFGSPNGTLSARACYLSSSPIMQAYIARYMATLHNDEDAVAFVSDYNPRHSLADIVDSIEDLHALLLRAEDKDAASTDFDLGKDYENINLPKVNNQADQLRLRLLHLLFKLRYPVAVLGREEEERRTRLAALVRELSELQARLDPFARYVDDNQEELSKDMQEPLPSSTPGFPAPDEDVLVEPAHADSEPVLAPSVADSYEG